MENSIKKFYYTKSWLINTDSHDIPELSLWKSTFEELFLELDKNHKDLRKDQLHRLFNPSRKYSL